jgi:hypothetical protein
VSFVIGLVAILIVVFVVAFVLFIVVNFVVDLDDDVKLSKDIVFNVSNNLSIGKL